MANAAADREDLIRSVIIWAIALAAAILVGFIVGKLLGLGRAAGTDLRRRGLHRAALPRPGSPQGRGARWRRPRMGTPRRRRRRR